MCLMQIIEATTDSRGAQWRDPLGMLFLECF